MLSGVETTLYDKLNKYGSGHDVRTIKKLQATTTKLQEDIPVTHLTITVLRQLVQVNQSNRQQQSLAINPSSMPGERISAHLVV